MVARGARRRNEPALVLIAVAAAAANALAIWNGTNVPRLVDILMVPAAFVLIELTALATRRDPFWARPVDAVARVVEVLALVPALLAPQRAIDIATNGPRATDWAMAAGLAALAWLIADARGTRLRAIALPAAAAMALFSIGAAFALPTLLAAAAIAIGLTAAFALTDFRGLIIAYSAAAYAVVAGTHDPRTALAVSVGAVGVFMVAILRTREESREVRFVGLGGALIALFLGEVASARVRSTRS